MIWRSICACDHPESHRLWQYLVPFLANLSVRPECEWSRQAANQRSYRWHKCYMCACWIPMIEIILKEAGEWNGWSLGFSRRNGHFNNLNTLRKWLIEADHPSPLDLRKLSTVAWNSRTFSKTDIWGRDWGSVLHCTLTHHDCQSLYL